MVSASQLRLQPLMRFKHGALQQLRPSMLPFVARARVRMQVPELPLLGQTTVRQPLTPGTWQVSDDPPGNLPGPARTRHAPLDDLLQKWLCHLVLPPRSVDRCQTHGTLDLAVAPKPGPN